MTRKLMRNAAPHASALTEQAQRRNVVAFDLDGHHAISMMIPAVMNAGQSAPNAIRA